MQCCVVTNNENLKLELKKVSEELNSALTIIKLLQKDVNSTRPMLKQPHEHNLIQKGKPERIHSRDYNWTLAPSGRRRKINQQDLSAKNQIPTSFNR